MRNRLGQFVAGAKRVAGAARSGAGRAVRAARRAAPAVRGAGSYAVSGARRAYRGAKAIFGGRTYHPGAVVKLAWGWWGADAIADPFVGGDQMSDTVPSGYQVWKKTHDVSAAYSAAKRRFFLNTGGYDTYYGTFADWSDPKVLRTWKGAVAPAIATGVDFTIATVAGTAGKHTKLPVIKNVLGYTEK